MAHQETPIFSIKSSQDEKLERMIQEIAGGEVDEKVALFKEELENHRQTHPFHKAVRSINEVEETNEGFEDSKVLQGAGKFLKHKAIPVAKKLGRAAGKAVKYGIVKPTMDGWDRDEAATDKVENKLQGYKERRRSMR